MNSRPRHPRPGESDRKPPKPSSIWRPLLRPPEDLVLLAGTGLALTSLTALLVGALWSPDLSRRLLAVAATNLVFGRVAAMSFGFALGLNHVAVIGQCDGSFSNLLLETILVLALYPLFVFSWRQLVRRAGRLDWGRLARTPTSKATAPWLGCVDP